MNRTITVNLGKDLQQRLNKYVETFQKKYKFKPNISGWIRQAIARALDEVGQ